MNREYLDFVLGYSNKNVIILYDKDGIPAFKIAKEKYPTNSDGISEYFLDNDDYNKDIAWNKFFRSYSGEYKGKDKKPKSTGGKKPYVMLMTNKIDELRKELKEEGVKNIDEIIGCLINFSKYSDWNTGKLIDKRQRLKKKQVTLKYNDLLEISDYSKSKFEKMKKVMENHNLLNYRNTNDNNRGYFISLTYFKKGNRRVIE